MVARHMNQNRFRFYEFFQFWKVPVHHGLIDLAIHVFQLFLRHLQFVLLLLDELIIIPYNKNIQYIFWIIYKRFL